MYIIWEFQKIKNIIVNIGIQTIRILWIGFVKAKHNYLIMNSINEKIGIIFRSMPNIYRYLGKDGKFSSIAYNKAAQSIERLPGDLHL